MGNSVALRSRSGTAWTMNIFSQIPARIFQQGYSANSPRIESCLNCGCTYECRCLWIKVANSWSTLPAESHQSWVRSCLPVASTTGRPPSQTAQLTDWASAPAQLCRLVPWHRERPHGTCTALSHRGKLGPAPLHLIKVSRPRALRGPISSVSLPYPSSEPTEKEESQVLSWPKSSFSSFL